MASVPEEVQVEPPSPLIGDVFKTILLSVLFIVGAPVNLLAACLLRKPSSSAGNWITEETNLLKRHLNLTDIFIVFFYCISEIGWLLTYRWMGGLILCKLVAFLRLLAFQISSNLIVCIALMRFLSTLFPPSGKWKRKRGKVIIGLAWVSAVMISSPQIPIWTIVQFPGHKGWYQCVPFWEDRNSSVDPRKMVFLKTAYNVYHLLFVFWIPFTMIAIFYGILSIKVWTIGSWNHSARTEHEIQQRDGLSRKESIDRPKLSNQHLHQETPLKENKAMKKQQQRSRRNKSNAILHNDASSKACFYYDHQVCYNSSYDERKEQDTGVQLLLFHRSAQRRTVRVSAQLTFAYVLCWAPYLAMDTWKTADYESYNRYGQNIPQLFNALVVFNSVLNPYLYGMYAAIREWL